MYRKPVTIPNPRTKVNSEVARWNVNFKINIKMSLQFLIDFIDFSGFQKVSISPLGVWLSTSSLRRVPPFGG